MNENNNKALVDKISDIGDYKSYYTQFGFSAKLYEVKEGTVTIGKGGMFTVSGFEVIFSSSMPPTEETFHTMLRAWIVGNRLQDDDTFKWKFKWKFKDNIATMTTLQRVTF